MWRLYGYVYAAAHRSVVSLLCSPLAQAGESHSRFGSGKSISTYPSGPPSAAPYNLICDRYALEVLTNWSVLCIADGCNWGAPRTLHHTHTNHAHSVQNHSPQHTYEAQTYCLDGKHTHTTHANPLPLSRSPQRSPRRQGLVRARRRSARRSRRFST